MKLRTQSAHQTQTLFDDVNLFSPIKTNVLASGALKAANKTANQIDPDIMAAERIAKQLQINSKGTRISIKSRQKGNEICEHLIAALKKQPVQGKFSF